MIRFFQLKGHISRQQERLDRNVDSNANVVHYVSNTLTQSIRDIKYDRTQRRLIRIF